MGSHVPRVQHISGAGSMVALSTRPPKENPSRLTSPGSGSVACLWLSLPGPLPSFVLGLELKGQGKA